MLIRTQGFCPTGNLFHIFDGMLEKGGESLKGGFTNQREK